MSETYAQIAANLLNEAAAFLLKLGEQNEATMPQMQENAAVFGQVANLISQQPQGKVDDMPHSEMAARLLADGATFFRSIAEGNAPIADQMNHNANVYDELAELVREDPMGVPPSE